MRPITNRLARRAAVGLTVLGTLAATTGCNDFLTGEKLTENPNAPVVASPLQLLVASQISLFNQQNGQLARVASMFVQQQSGTNNQQLDYGSTYNIPENAFVQFWNGNYTGGGLVDLREIQRQARESQDQRLLGIALVMEALRIGTTAAIWGDIPYSEAADPDVKTPKLDGQEAVYNTIQAKLDTAITALGAVPATAAALPQDVIFQGNAARWRKVAATLKARYHLHTAERRGQAAYQAARDAALQGIDEAPTTVNMAADGQAPGNLRTVHGNTVNVDGNQWGQFLRARQDMAAGQVFVEALQRRNDPRLARYFIAASDGAFRGANQFGDAPVVGGRAAPLSTIGFGTTGSVRYALDYRQPIVTWEENQLILAEARFQLGDRAGALGNVNAVRRTVGLPDLTDAQLSLAQIMEEKWVALFQNIEAWSDYRRTCFPRLTPGGPNRTSATEIPGRIVYAFSERNANPNIPAPGAQPARNWNDPNACPRP